MRNAYYETGIPFDTLFEVIDKPLPPSPMTDPKYFLSVNEDAILRGLDDSRREQRRIIVSRYATVFGVFAIIAMLLTFSREVRAFAKEILYSVIEWFSPQEDESGVTFDIEDAIHSAAPNTGMVDTDEKISFTSLSEVDKTYSRSIYVLSSPSFTLTDGFIQNETICLNYTANGIKVQIIAEPIQESGSVNYHFNDDSFSKMNMPGIGTFYYDLSDDKLFGGIMTANTNLIIRVPQKASAELLDAIVQSLSLYR